MFRDEILPLRIGQAIIDMDDTIRPGTTAEGLAKLKPAFADWGDGSTTAGNASGVGDGVALHVITTRANAEKEGMQIVAKWGGCVVAGTPIVERARLCPPVSRAQELSRGTWA